MTAVGGWSNDGGNLLVLNTLAFCVVFAYNWRLMQVEVQKQSTHSMQLDQLALLPVQLAWTSCAVMCILYAVQVGVRYVITKELQLAEYVYILKFFGPLLALYLLFSLATVRLYLRRFTHDKKHAGHVPSSVFSIVLCTLLATAVAYHAVRSPAPFVPPSPKHTVVEPSSGGGASSSASARSKKVVDGIADLVSDGISSGMHMFKWFGAKARGLQQQHQKGKGVRAPAMVGGLSPQVVPEANHPKGSGEGITAADVVGGPSPQVVPEANEAHSLPLLPADPPHPPTDAAQETAQHVGAAPDPSAS